MSVEVRSTRSRVSRSALLAVTLAAVPLLSSAGNAVTTATGQRCTVVGTVDRDVLVGTRGSDVICGRGGNDTITGKAGNDVLEGGAGNDTLIGRGGRDTLIGGTGGDTLIGGDGTDTAAYTDHTRRVAVTLDGIRNDGASGEGDLVTGTTESLTGGDANDTLSGDNGDNGFTGGAGDDVITGGGGDDNLQGSAGDDHLLGEADDDALTGGPGADVLDGGSGVNPCHTDLNDTATLDSCEDVTPPQLVEWSVSPDKINTSTGDQVITVTARVRDDLSGVQDSSGGESIAFHPLSPRGGYGPPASCSWDNGCASGTPTDATFKIDITIPQYSHQGTWTFTGVRVYDRVRNEGNFAPDEDPMSSDPTFYNGP